jgi:hypothetical protein
MKNSQILDFVSFHRGKCKNISFIQNQKNGKIILNIAPKED